ARREPDETEEHPPIAPARANRQQYDPEQDAGKSHIEMRIARVDLPSNGQRPIIRRELCGKDEQYQVAAEKRHRHQDAIPSRAPDDRVIRPVHFVEIPWEPDHFLAVNPVNRHHPEDPRGQPLKLTSLLKSALSRPLSPDRPQYQEKNG